MSTFRDLLAGYQAASQGQKSVGPKISSINVPEAPRDYGAVIGAAGLADIRDQAARRQVQASTHDWSDVFRTPAVNHMLGGLTGVGQALDYVGQPIRMVLADAIRDEVDFDWQDYGDAFTFNDKAIAARHPDVTPTGEMRASELFSVMGWDTVEYEGEGFFGEAKEQGERALRFAAAFVAEGVTDPVNWFTGGLKGLGKLGADTILKAGMQRVTQRIAKIAADEGPGFLAKHVDDLTVDGRPLTSFEKDVATDLKLDLSDVDNAVEYRHADLDWTAKVGIVTGKSAEPSYLDDIPSDPAEAVDEAAALTQSNRGFEARFMVNGEDRMGRVFKRQFDLAETISRKQFHVDTPMWRNYTDHALDPAIDPDIPWSGTTGGLSFMMPFFGKRPISLGKVTQKTQGLASQFTRGSDEAPGAIRRLVDSEVMTNQRARWRNWRKTEWRGNQVAPLQPTYGGTLDDRMDSYFAWESSMAAGIVARRATYELAQEIHEVALIREQEDIIATGTKKLSKDLHRTVREEIGNAWASERNIDSDALRREGVSITDEAVAQLDELNNKSRIKFHEFAAKARKLDPEGIGLIITEHKKYSPITLNDDFRFWMEKNPRGMVAVVDQLERLVGEGADEAMAIRMIGQVAGVNDLDQETFYQFMDLMGSVKLRGGSTPGPEQIGDVEVLQLRSIGAGAFIVEGEAGDVVTKGFQDIGLLNERFTKLFNFYGRESYRDFPKKGISGVLVTDPAESIAKWKRQIVEAVQERIFKSMMVRAGYIREVDETGKRLIWGRWAARNVEDLNMAVEIVGRITESVRMLEGNGEIPPGMLDDVMRQDFEKTWPKINIFGKEIEVPEDFLQSDQVLYHIDKLLAVDETLKGAKKQRLAMIRRALQNAQANRSSFDLELDHLVEAAIGKRWRGYVREMKKSMRKHLVDNMGGVHEALRRTGEPPDLQEIITEWTDRYQARIFDQLAELDDEMGKELSRLIHEDMKAYDFRVTTALDEATDDFVETMRVHKHLRDQGFESHVDISDPEQLTKFMDSLGEIQDMELETRLATFLDLGEDAQIDLNQVLSGLTTAEMARLKAGRTWIPTVIVEEEGKLVAGNVGWTIPNKGQADIWVEYQPGMGGIEYPEGGGKPVRSWPEKDQITAKGKNTTTWAGEKYNNFAVNMGWKAEDGESVADWYDRSFIEVVPGLMKYTGPGSMPFYVVGDINSAPAAQKLNEIMHDIWLEKYGPHNTKAVADPAETPLRIWGLRSDGRKVEWRKPWFLEDLQDKGFVAKLMENPLDPKNPKQFIGVWEFWQKWRDLKIKQYVDRYGSDPETVARAAKVAKPDIEFAVFFDMIKDMLVRRPKLAPGYKAYDSYKAFRSSRDYVPVQADIVNIDAVKRNDDIARQLGVAHPENIEPAELYDELIDFAERGSFDPDLKIPVPTSTQKILQSVEWPFTRTSRMGKPIYTTDDISDLTQIKYAGSYVHWLVNTAREGGVEVHPSLAKLKLMPLEEGGVDYELPLLEPEQVKLLEEAVREAYGLDVNEMFQPEGVNRVPIGFEVLAMPPKEVQELVMSIAAEHWPHLKPSMKDFHYWWDKVKQVSGTAGLTGRDFRRGKQSAFNLYEAIDLDPSGNLVDALKDVRRVDDGNYGLGASTEVPLADLLRTYQELSQMYETYEFPSLDEVNPLWEKFIDTHYPGAWEAARAQRDDVAAEQVSRINAEFGRKLQRRERKLWAEAVKTVDIEQRKLGVPGELRVGQQKFQSKYGEDAAAAWTAFYEATNGQTVPGDMATLIREYEQTIAQASLASSERVLDPSTKDMFGELVAVVFRDKYYDGDIDKAYTALDDLRTVEADFKLDGGGLSETARAPDRLYSRADTPSRQAEEQLNREIEALLDAEDRDGLLALRDQLTDDGVYEMDADLVDDARYLDDYNDDPMRMHEDMGADMDDMEEGVNVAGSLRFAKERQRSSVRSEQLYGTDLQPRDYALADFSDDEVYIDLAKLLTLSGGPIDYPRRWISVDHRSPKRFSVYDQLGVDIELEQNVTRAGLVQHRINEATNEAGGVDVDIDELLENQRVTMDPRRYGVERGKMVEDVEMAPGAGGSSFQLPQQKELSRSQLPGVFDPMRKTFVDRQNELRGHLSRIRAGTGALRRRAFSEVLGERVDELGVWMGFVETASGREAAGAIGIDLAAATEVHRKLLLTKDPTLFEDANFRKALALGATLEEAGYMTPEMHAKMVGKFGFGKAQGYQREGLTKAAKPLSEELRKIATKSPGPDYTVAEFLRSRMGEARRTAEVKGTRVQLNKRTVKVAPDQTRWGVITFDDYKKLNEELTKEKLAATRKGVPFSDDFASKGTTKLEDLDYVVDVGRNGDFGGNAFIVASGSKSGRAPKDLAYLEGTPHPYLMEPVYAPRTRMVEGTKADAAGIPRKVNVESFAPGQPGDRVVGWKPVVYQKVANNAEARAKFTETLWRQLENGIDSEGVLPAGVKPAKGKKPPEPFTDKNAVELEGLESFPEEQLSKVQLARMATLRRRRDRVAARPIDGLIGDDFAQYLVNEFQGKVLFHIGQPDDATHAQVLSDTIDWLKSPFWKRYRKTPLRYEKTRSAFQAPGIRAKAWNQKVNTLAVEKVESFINEVFERVDQLTTDQVVDLDYYQRLAWMNQHRDWFVEQLVGAPRVLDAGSKSKTVQSAIKERELLNTLNAAMNKALPDTQLTTFRLTDGRMVYRAMAPGGDFVAFDEYFGLRGLKSQDLSAGLADAVEMGHDRAITEGLDLPYELGRIIKKKEAMQADALRRAEVNAKATYRRRLKKYQGELDEVEAENLRREAEAQAQQDRLVREIDDHMELMINVFDAAWASVRSGNSKRLTDLIGTPEELTDTGVALQKAMVGLTDFQKDQVEFLLQSATMASRFTEVHSHKEWLKYWSGQRAQRITLSTAMEDILDGVFSLKNKPGPKWQDHVELTSMVSSNVDQANRALAYLLGKLHRVPDPNNFVPPHMVGGGDMRKQSPSFDQFGPNLNQKTYSGPKDAIDTLTKTLEEIEKHRFMDQLINIRGIDIKEGDKRALRDLIERMRVTTQEWMDLPNNGMIPADRLGLGGIYNNTVLNEALGYEIMKASMRRQIQATAQQNIEVLGLAQSVKAFWMKSATVARLAFHQRNLISVFWNNMYVGVPARDTASQMKDAFHLVKNMRQLRYMDYSELFDMESATEVLLEGIDDKELYLRMIEAGVLNSAFSSQIPRSTRRGLQHRMRRLIPLHHDFIAFDYGSDSMLYVEMLGRAAAFKKYYDPRYPEMTSMIGKTMSDLVHFDYSDVSALQQKYLKPIFPFFTWTTRNIPLQMRMLMESPKYMNMYFKAQANWNLNYGDSDDPDDAEATRNGAWILPFRRDDTNGDWLQAVWNPALPFQDMMELPLFGDDNPDPDSFVSRFSPTEWIGWASGMAAPQFKYLFDSSEKGEARMAPRGWNELFYAAGVGSPEGVFGTGMGATSRSFVSLPSGDVRIPKPLESVLRGFPHLNEMQDLAGVESNNPYTVSNQGLLPSEVADADHGWEDSAALLIGSQLAEGFGFQWTGPEDLYWHYYDLNAYYEDMDAIGKAMAPPPDEFGFEPIPMPVLG